MHYNIPNLVTLARLSLVPCLILFYSLPFLWAKWLAAVLFFIAVMTDWLDGFLARRLNQFTRFGAFLDPVADKLLIAAGLILLMAEHTGFLFRLAVLIIVGREILMSALREWMALCQAASVISVSRMGKFKTVFQGAAVSILLTPVPNSWRWWVTPVGYLALFIAVVLTVVSLWTYCAKARPVLMDDTKAP